VAAESGDDPRRYTDPEIRTHCSGRAPIARASGTSSTRDVLRPDPCSAPAPPQA